MYCEIKFTYWQIYGGSAAMVPWPADLRQQLGVSEYSCQSDNPRQICFVYSRSHLEWVIKLQENLQAAMQGCADPADSASGSRLLCMALFRPQTWIHLFCHASLVGPFWPHLSSADSQNPESAREFVVCVWYCRSED